MQACPGGLGLPREVSIAQLAAQSAECTALKASYSLFLCQRDCDPAGSNSKWRAFHRLQ